MTPPWPPGFERIPDADWTHRDLADLAQGYDTVEHHGWYANLDPTVEEVAGWLDEGDRVVDYSGGTGILASRLLDAVGALDFGLLVADSSPKFLRLALDKLGDEPRVAFRRLRYLQDEGRVEHLHEVLPPALADGGLDAVISTNAIHLYHELPGTLASWARCVRPGGNAFVQSGNIRRDDAPSDRWIIDETVDAIDVAARAIVREDPDRRAWRDVLDDEERMEAYGKLRRRFFLPVRPLDHYTGALEAAGFEIASVAHRPVPVEVEEWYEFLSVYHEGVLGWIGGSKRVEGEPPDDAAVEERLRVMREAMDRVFAGEDRFTAEWTYLTGRRRA